MMRVPDTALHQRSSPHEDTDGSAQQHTGQDETPADCQCSRIESRLFGLDRIGNFGFAGFPLGFGFGCCHKLLIEFFVRFGVEELG